MLCFTTRCKRAAYAFDECCELVVVVVDAVVTELKVAVAADDVVETAVE